MPEQKSPTAEEVECLQAQGIDDKNGGVGGGRQAKGLSDDMGGVGGG